MSGLDDHGCEFVGTVLCASLFVSLSPETPSLLPLAHPPSTSLSDLVLCPPCDSPMLSCVFPAEGRVQTRGSAMKVRALPVAGTAPALAKVTAGVELAGGTRTATTASPRRWSPRHMTRQGLGRKDHGKVTLDADLRHCCEKVGTSSSNLPRHCHEGTTQAGTDEGKCEPGWPPGDAR